MNSVRRVAVLKLATAAYELKMDVLRGDLKRDDDGRWYVGDGRLQEWLNAHQGEEVVLVLGSLDDDREVEVRSCRTCGRDYAELECPHCRANRIRLRGRP
jgi:hypothetical protein